MSFKPYMAAGSLALVMAACLAYAFVAGEFVAEGAALLRMPWGIASLVEIYVGLGLFFCWVFYRERSKLAASVWLIAAIAIGNIVACLYVLMAAYRSNGDQAKFFMGHHALGLRSL